MALTQPSPSTSRLARAALLALFASMPAGAEELRQRLAGLAAEHGFTVKGLERVGEEQAAPIAGTDLAETLDTLLGNYGHAIVRGRDGRIERLVVTGRRSAPTPAGIRVPTTRQGSHHSVEVGLVGPGRRRVTLSMVIDTGASTMVLPDSLAARLGFDHGALRPVRVQTANGAAEARAGTLASVEVGAALARRVEVVFVADDLLGGARLLGMDFLGRYRFTLDDEHDRLLLLAR